MPLKSWLKHPIVELKKWRDRRRTNVASEEVKQNLPLREFVYLDAVSLHSLLVSQNATIPNEILQAISRADEAELTGTIGAQVGSELLGSAKTETSARYQTSNSNSMQSSRKAVIQTLFKELRELSLDFKLAARNESPKRLNEVAAIPNGVPPAVEAASAFTRGTLVEVEVTLAVDPVFKLGAMMNEWTAMADDFPGMFADQGTLGFLREAAPIMKVLDRFLAGLIPIKATATNYVVAEVDGAEYVVHKAVIADLKVNTRPLRIAGVTEHIGYWKDVRRVLFSDARFTVLCRVARDGLHEKWTPVKLADLFSDVAPDFVDQVNAIRSPSASDTQPAPLQVQNRAMSDALTRYKESLIPAELEWRAEHETEFEALRDQITSGPTDPVAQRDAFDRVRELVVETLTIERPTADADLMARRSARARAGLELFPSPGINLSPVAAKPPAKIKNPDERILDTEVVAIYW